ncbi:alanine racemase [Phenylobacterium sp.]|jgi:alanine racemase|uniref:alanine racemase n=1 Tax=Phenylobacterium sp. TaxID=1871053 RepID=UPI002E37CDF1|nr:alanine racemase [Phenylobacterium sp.]HEX4709190.1 alanine racemase [Phenylobacterium sp.]
MADPPSARLTIDLDALAHNHAVLRREAAGAEVAPVLKSDGYGLGAGPVARRLWAEGARSFFVARLAEGEALREALSPERPATIYVLDGMTDGAGALLRAAGLTPVLSSLPQVTAATAHASGAAGPWRVALSLDTGMNRQGLTPEEARAVVQSTDRLRGLDIALLISHLGSASEPDNPRNVRQLERFLEVRSLFPGARASLAASAGTFLGAHYRFDMVRPGIGLFGGGPLERPDDRLRAVATLTAPILDVRNLRAGDVVGYGESVRIEAPTRVAVVAAGYTDGVIRAAKAGGHAWFAGAPRRLLIVNMDILVIEIGDAEAAVGQPVELLGPNAPLDDLATAGGTVAHEILVRLSRRAERVYLGGA